MRICATALIVLLGCAFSQTPAPAVLSVEARRTALIDRHNRHRDAPLLHHPELTTAAQSHAEWMAGMQIMSHSGQDGSTPAGRIVDAGYSWSTYGENIAYGQQSPESVMRAWLGSPGHRRNIKSSSYGDIGVGIATADTGHKYWCVTFGSKSYNGEEWSGSWATPECGDE